MKGAMRSGPGRASGWTLVEMAVALAVLGIVVLGSVWLMQMRQTAHTRAQQEESTTLARAALLAYWSASHRLPCADADGDGWEDDTDCPSAGFLPYKTLGVLTLEGVSLRYGVQRHLVTTSSPAMDIDLTQRSDRFLPTWLNPSSLVLTRQAFGHENLMDVCGLLTEANAANLAADGLAIQAPSGVRQAVAAVVVSAGMFDRDGQGSLFDGRNATASPSDPTFEAPPTEPAHARVDDDRLVAIGFDDAYQYLGCPSALGVVGHGHFNTAAASVIAHKSMEDYRVQLQILSDLAAASITSASAGIVTATAGLATAVASSLDAIAWSILTYGAASAAAIVAIVADIGAHTVALATAPAALGLAIAGKIEADNRLVSADLLLAQSRLLADPDTGIPSRARLGDTLGF